MSTEKTIQSSVRRLFDNHKYVLTNSYIFNWESDFFSITKTGTCYEVEVKISKADFKKDFSKDKHALFTAILKGKRFTVTGKEYGYYGDIIGEYSKAKLALRSNWHFKNDESFIHEEDSFGYWERRDRNIYLHDSTNFLRAQTCQIKVTDLSKINVPNRFFYACPEGLIKLTEVPEYAGLIYVKDGAAYLVKKAPFITKDNVCAKLTRILLEKFWYLSEGFRRTINYHQIKTNTNGS